MNVQTTDQFAKIKRTYIIHNAQPRGVTVAYGGTQWTVPGIDEFSLRPGFDADGDPIPGTLVISDTFFGEESGTAFGAGYSGLPSGDGMLIDAAAIVRFVLGYQPETRKFESHWALGGLSFIPNGSSKEDIRAIVRAGSERWHQLDLKNCYSIVQAYEERSMRLGIKPPIDEEYERAVAKLNAHRTTFAQKAVPDVLEDDAEDELAFAAFAKAKAMEIAAKSAPFLNAEGRLEVARQLLEDPETRQRLNKSYRIQKKGKAEPDSQALQALVDEQQAAEAIVAKEAQAVELGM